PGEGVVVGHPDTGYTRHPEIFPGRIRLDGAYDFLRDDGDPSDELDDSGAFASPGHGTSTSSVIASDFGSQRAGGQPYVTGAAPRATVVPLRVMKSPVLWSTRNVTQAIDHATAIGCHVISMSLGTGLWWEVDALREAIRRAVHQGVIVVAAAGNYVGPVTWPGRFDEVVCVAACNAERRPWFHSCAGSAVDVTAPGESVWRASASKDRAGAVKFGVARSDGTSYSTALVAGVAALWLSYHGRDQLIAAFGRENLCSLFRAVARASCMPMVGLPDWQQHDFGAGIINAHKVLQIDPRSLHAAPRGARAAELTRKAAVDGTAQFVRELQPDRLAGALGVSESNLAQLLAERGKEIALRLATDPALRQPVSVARSGAGGAPEATAASLNGASRELRAALAAARRPAAAPAAPAAARRHAAPAAPVRNGRRSRGRRIRPRPEA
ncbi:MAG TPA: S8/S53 family peptidase, partial [Kofleriaceae bacterium]|nr:S8/S53 family peptidase [Kofleriaceae bacterium]